MTAKLTSVMANIADLKLDPANARKHNKKNLAAIEASLKRFGQVEALVVQKSTGIVIGGNGRLEAMRSMGWKECAIVEVDVDSTQATALGIALNRSAELGQWSEDVLGKLLHGLREDGLDLAEIGFDLDDLTEFKGQDFGTSGITEENQDEVPEVKESFVKRGEIWQLGDHRLMCGDSTSKEDLERLMDGKKADLLLTDPPYGVSYADKNAFLNAISRGNSIQERIENDHKTPDEMNAFWNNVLSNAHSACSDKSSYYIFSPQGGDLMMMMSIKHANWQIKHMLVWVKNNHVLGRCDYNYKHEPVFFGWKEKGTHEFFGNGSCTSVLEFNKPLKNDLHPTMKPVELCAYLIENSSKKDGIVLDIFCGSGSTLIASEKTGRKCYGCEIDPHYASVIVKRWQDATGKTAVKLG